MMEIELLIQEFLKTNLGDDEDDGVPFTGGTKVASTPTPTPVASASASLDMDDIKDLADSVLGD